MIGPPPPSLLTRFGVSRFHGVTKELAECLRGFLVGLRDEVRVDVERRARVPVAQPSGDGADVDARREKARRHVVPEIMEANARDPGLLTDLRKARVVESGCQGVEPSTEWLKTKLSE